MMNRFTTGLIFSLFIIAVLGFASPEHNSFAPDKRFGLDIEKFVERHNYYRKQVGVPPVKWSDDLAEYALEWATELAKTCKMKHRDQDEYGENIYWDMSLSSEFEVVDFWAEEEQYFNHRNRICEKNKIGIYGHYTQVIWRETTEIGAAVVKCKNGGYIWVCNYNPPGNWVGEKVY